MHWMIGKRSCKNGTMNSSKTPNAEFEGMLTGGHPNSLGRTIEVVEIVLNDPSRLVDLFSCYFSDDEVVRLRVSNAMKRVCREQPEWLIPFIDDFLDEISKISQASTQWTLADLFRMLWASMTQMQQARAKELLKNNLTTWNDWIVLNSTMQALSDWSMDDEALRNWLIPKLETLRDDDRRSVSGRAKKMLVKLNA